MSAKYIEIKYPVVEDVCQLMKCPFTFDEFVQMEQVILQLFEWNLQFPTSVEIIQTFLAQGVIFSNDKVVIEGLSISVENISSESKEKMLKKVRKLCQHFFPNLLIHEPLLTLGVPTPLFLAVAIVLEARRTVGIIDLWPRELDLMLFGCEIPRSQEHSDPRNMIFRVLE